jgi:hypothetical protein
MIDLVVLILIDSINIVDQSLTKKIQQCHIFKNGGSSRQRPFEGLVAQFLFQSKNGWGTHSGGLS